MKIGIKKIKSMKNKEKISVLTAYDFQTAKIMDGKVDMILIGDSLSMVIYGNKDTTKVTMQDMLRHTQAVTKATKRSLTIADMPIGSYDNEKLALENAKKFLEVGADSVKIENKPEIAKILIKNNIEVMGHVGLTPQTITKFKVQGKEQEKAEEITKLALELEQAGCFSIVLECIPRDLAEEITNKLIIPTIGIGAGPDCDGQVLVINDMLGLNPDFKPKFLKKYENLSEKIKRAIKLYNSEVKQEKFPTDEHSFH